MGSVSRRIRRSAWKVSGDMPEPGARDTRGHGGKKVSKKRAQNKRLSMTAKRSRHN